MGKCKNGKSGWRVYRSSLYYSNFSLKLFQKIDLKRRQCGNNFKVLRRNNFEPKFYIQSNYYSSIRKNKDIFRCAGLRILLRPRTLIAVITRWPTLPNTRKCTSTKKRKKERHFWYLCRNANHSMRDHFTPTKTAIIKKMDNCKC